MVQDIDVSSLGDLGADASEGFQFDWNQFSTGLLGLAGTGLNFGAQIAAINAGNPYTPPTSTSGGAQPAQKTTAPAQSGMSTTMLVVVLVVILVILAMAAYFITKKSA